jgi:hypothetical protein
MPTCHGLHTGRSPINDSLTNAVQRSIRYRRVYLAITGLIAPGATRVEADRRRVSHRSILSFLPRCNGADKLSSPTIGRPMSRIPSIGIGLSQAIQTHFNF